MNTTGKVVVLTDEGFQALEFGLVEKKGVEVKVREVVVRNVKFDEAQILWLIDYCVNVEALWVGGYVRQVQVLQAVDEVVCFEHVDEEVLLEVGVVGEGEGGEVGLAS